MKELKKKKKKTRVFENLNVNAFHEDGASYSRGGTYRRGTWPGYNEYVERDSMPLDDDILF